MQPKKLSAMTVKELEDGIRLKKSILVSGYDSIFGAGCSHALLEQCRLIHGRLAALLLRPSLMPCFCDWCNTHDDAATYIHKWARLFIVTIPWIPMRGQYGWTRLKVAGLYTYRTALSKLSDGGANVRARLAALEEELTTRRQMEEAAEMLSGLKMCV